VSLIRKACVMALLAVMLRAQDPAIVQIKVIEGEGAVYAVGSRATRGIAIQVTDETGRPVEGASVSFRLPDDGPSGSFASGSKTEIAMTRADGRANAWGMQWNRTAGLVEIRVTAAKGAVRAGIVCAQYLAESATAANAGSAKSKVGGGSHKWLWIAVVAAGAAGGALAAGAIASKSSSSAAPSGVQIGTPTIILGHP
jgi:hypothetical protein